MSEVNLFYLSPNTTGGWVTFTSHLARCLQDVGVKCNLFKITGKTWPSKKDFGYGLKYANVDLGRAVQITQSAPTLIVAVAKKFSEQAEYLISRGAKLVVHDPTELKNLPRNLEERRCVVIRQAGLRFMPGANFIRHPYKRMGPPVEYDRYLAGSTCRIDFDKNTTILLDANRILEKKIAIYGFENRLYTKFKIMPYYSEWEQSKVAYPRTENAAFDILSRVKFAVDMSLIKGDGGGTQYSFLEAWDAGAVPVIHRDWVRQNDDMKPGVNCIVAYDGKSLASVLNGYDTIVSGETMRRAYVEGGHLQLFQHQASIVGVQYKEFLLASS